MFIIFNFCVLLGNIIIYRKKSNKFLVGAKQFVYKNIFHSISIIVIYILKQENILGDYSKIWEAEPLKLLFFGCIIRVSNLFVSL